MNSIKECDKYDYMNSISLHGFTAETIIVKYKNFVYIARINKVHDNVLGFHPVQHMDVTRSGFDGRVLYVRRADYNVSLIPREAFVDSDGCIIGEVQWGR